MEQNRNPRNKASYIQSNNFPHGCQEYTIRKEPSLEQMMLAKLDIDDVLQEARIAGYFDVGEINYAILESNGHLSFLPKQPIIKIILGYSPSLIENKYGELLYNNINY